MADEPHEPLSQSHATLGGAVLLGFVRLECRRETEQDLRAELMLILEPTRAEAGCLGINLYESLRDPHTFMIHSSWFDEAAFDAHAQLPHMVRFLGLVGGLVTNPVQALRTNELR